MAGLAAIDLMQLVVRSWLATAAEEAQAPAGREGEEEEEGAADIVGGRGRSRDGRSADGSGTGEYGLRVRALREWAAARERAKRNGRESNSREGVRGKERPRWRDLFNRIIRWRQLSEPADTVTWIDQLKWEEGRDGAPAKGLLAAEGGHAER